MSNDRTDHEALSALAKEISKSTTVKEGEVLSVLGSLSATDIAALLHAKGGATGLIWDPDWPRPSRPRDPRPPWWPLDLPWPPRGPRPWPSPGPDPQPDFRSDAMPTAIRPQGFNAPDAEMPIDGPVPLPELDKPILALPGLMRRISKVESVEVKPVGILPDGTAVVTATGRVNSMGWKAPRLVPLTQQEPGIDQSYDLVFVALPPTTPNVFPALQPIKASHMIPGKAAADAKQVRVHAAANSLSAEMGKSATVPDAGRMGFCSADAVWVGKRLIRRGQPSEGNPAKELKEDEIPGGYRVIGPGTMVTMDFRPERSNIYVDKNDMIIRVGCG